MMAQMLQMIQERYLIRRAVSSGAFGTVYQADDTRLQRTVALKEIVVDEHTEVASHRSPLYEARTLASFGPHAHIPSVFDVFLENDAYYIAMQWIEGNTLDVHRQHIGEVGKPLPFGEFFRLGIQLCRVVRFLHERQVPIIVRDIKPQNIMVARASSYLYLVDLGAAISFTPGLTRDVSRCWCSGYAAPELQHGQAPSSVLTDLYSMGITLYELLFNRRFTWVDGKGDISLQAYPALADLLACMTDQAPDARPQSVRSVESSLRRLRAEVRAHPQEVLEEARQEVPVPPHMLVFAL